jgi:hypothetical protein
LRQRVIRTTLRFLGFGCGHLSLVHARAEEDSFIPYFQIPLAEPAMRDALA